MAFIYAYHLLSIFSLYLYTDLFMNLLIYYTFNDNNIYNFNMDNIKF